MGNGHAILSPSAAHRWMQCPASVRMTRDLPPGEESVYAREGTQFHTLCEVKARREILGEDSDPDYLDWALETEEEWHEDQLAYAEDWIKFLKECLAEEPGATLLLEQRVDTGIPGCWGTADAVIIYSDWIQVIDIKYGAGIKVSAFENPQLMLYGVGALSLVEDPLKVRDVMVVVWQPRKDNFDDYMLSRSELVKWRDSLIPIAELALGEDAPFGPSETACRFCPIAGECAPRARYMLAQDFGNPDLMTGDELAEAVARMDDFKRWLADVEEVALRHTYEKPGSVPGFKVVRSGGRRRLKNPEQAIQALLDAGYDEDTVVNRSPATFGQLDKLVGPERLQEVLGDLLDKSEGRLSLAREGDPRPSADAFSSAESDFADITE